MMLIAVDKLGRKFPRVQKAVFRSLPLVILLLCVLYMIVSCMKIYKYINKNGIGMESLRVLTSHPNTFTTLVTFFALLTFYQLLQDRFEERNALNFTKLSQLEVVTKDVHNQI